MYVFLVSVVLVYYDLSNNNKNKNLHLTYYIILHLTYYIISLLHGLYYVITKGVTFSAHSTTRKAGMMIHIQIG